MYGGGMSYIEDGITYNGDYWWGDGGLWFDSNNDGSPDVFFPGINPNPDGDSGNEN